MFSRQLSIFKYICVVIREKSDTIFKKIGGILKKKYSYLQVNHDIDYKCHGKT